MMKAKNRILGRWLVVLVFTCVGAISGTNAVNAQTLALTSTSNSFSVDVASNNNRENSATRYVFDVLANEPYEAAILNNLNDHVVLMSEQSYLDLEAEGIEVNAKLLGEKGLRTGAWIEIFPDPHQKSLDS